MSTVVCNYLRKDILEIFKMEYPWNMHVDSTE